MNSSIKMSLVAAMTAMSITGCGSTGTSDTTATDEGNGTLADRLVHGARYVSGTRSGYTDGNGTFYFQKGQSVVFSIGGINIHKIDANVTANASDELGPQPVSKQAAAFLQTIQDDNGSTALKISDAVIAKLANYKSLDFTDGNASIDESTLQTTLNNLLKTTLKDINVTRGNIVKHFGVDLNSSVTISDAEKELNATISDKYKDINGTYSGFFFANAGAPNTCISSGEVNITADVNITNTNVSGYAGANNAYTISGNVLNYSMLSGTAGDGSGDFPWIGTFGKEHNVAVVNGKYVDGECSGIFKTAQGGVVYEDLNLDDILGIEYTTNTGSVYEFTTNRSNTSEQILVLEDEDGTNVYTVSSVTNGVVSLPAAQNANVYFSAEPAIGSYIIVDNDDGLMIEKIVKVGASTSSSSSSYITENTTYTFNSDAWIRYTTSGSSCISGATGENNTTGTCTAASNVLTMTDDLGTTTVTFTSDTSANLYINESGMEPETISNAEYTTASN
jgi:hypothetical protein